VPDDRRTILVIDDDASRHGDLEAWIRSMGHEPLVRGVVPADPSVASGARLLVVHAGYGRMRPGFPRPDRGAEAIHWLLGDPSYLFHEELDGFAALGRSLDPSVALVAMTGGSGRDIPLADLVKLAAGRPVVSWNVIELVATTSIEEVLRGPGAGEPDPEVIESEIRHDLLNRLWNLALAAADKDVDRQEIAEIIEGDDDQSTLDVLVARAAGLTAGTRADLVEAIREAKGGRLAEAMSSLARTAIAQMEGR
jgi:hypothetical protein